MLHLIKIISMLSMVMITSAGKIVKLRLVTTSCRSSCFHYHDNKCPSSIKIDKKEMSYQKDGFNIVVINTHTGKVKKRKHIRWFNNLFFASKYEFKDFFASITFNSTVIISFQNMCKDFNEKWYTYLSSFKNNIPYRLYSYQAIVIACKGPCPSAIEADLPYTYYSAGSRFVKKITLLLGGAQRPPSKNPSRFKNKDDGNIALIAGVIAAAVVVLTIIYSVYLYCQRRGTASGAYHGTSENVPMNERSGETTCDRTTGNGQFSDEPIYEEIGGNGHIYQVIAPVDEYQDITVMKDSSSEHCYDDPTIGVEYDNPPVFRTHDYEEPDVPQASAPPISPTFFMDDMSYEPMTGQTENTLSSH